MMRYLLFYYRVIENYRRSKLLKNSMVLRDF